MVINLLQRDIWTYRFINFSKLVTDSISSNETLSFKNYKSIKLTREGFLRKNTVAVLFFQNCAIHPYT